MAWLTVFRSRRMMVMVLLGFSSGLPLLLTGQTLQAWLTTSRLSLRDIAAMSAVGLAYTFKFAWAPLLDRFRLPWLGRRLGWVVTLQLALIGAIAAMSLFDPRRDLAIVCGIAIAIAVLSASQDIVLDAYQVDLLAPEERAFGSSIFVTGYRAAMVTTSALAFVLADHVGWTVAWLAMAALMAVGLAGTLLAEEPAQIVLPPRSIAQSLVLPVVDLWTRYRRGLFVVLAFVATYRFGDYFAQSLLIAFLQRGVGFDLTELAVTFKALGFAAVVAGGLVGGLLVARFGLRRMLLAFGVVSATTHLLYLWLAAVGKSVVVLCIAVACDYTAGAMGATGLVAFLMTVCSPAVSATQFALLTSLASVGQRVFGVFADRVVDAVGWTGFFVVCAALAIPGLALVWPATREATAHEAAAREAAAAE